MIPQANIVEWRAFAPWLSDAQVEQDLVLSRAIIQIYSNPVLKDQLAFRGGTALNKIYFSPPTRYSEDIDLVQIHSSPVGSLLNALRETLDPWLGKPRFKKNEIVSTLIYRFESEIPPITPLRIKIEINTREHFTILGYKEKNMLVDSTWFKGSANITTYSLEELLGSKLRALYQRKKGRDLFDLHKAFEHYPTLDVIKILNCFTQYSSFVRTKITGLEFQKNFLTKLKDKAFLNDILPLLPNGINYDARHGSTTVLNMLSKIG